MADSEQFVHEVAERVRAIVAEAEQRAARIVRDAEQEAERIRARAEAEGRERLAEVREALDGLEGKLGGAPDAGHSVPDPDTRAGPATVPEPEPEPEPEPQPANEPEPPRATQPERPPDPEPPPDASSAAGNGDTPAEDVAGARLVAMNMALDGASREQIATRLGEDFALGNAGELADEILARARK